MKPKGGFDNAPVKVSAEQLQSYYDRGLIGQKQYDKVMSEMAKTGSKNTTVILTGNTASGSQQPPQQPKKDKEDKSNSISRVLKLRLLLTELIRRIRRRIEQQTSGRQWSTEDRQLNSKGKFLPDSLDLFGITFQWLCCVYTA